MYIVHGTFQIDVIGNSSLITIRLSIFNDNNEIRNIIYCLEDALHI